MQKNLYDYSTLIWSPQGRLYQVEYAMEAVNQGNLLLGLRSKDTVVLCGLKSSSHDVLSFHQEKLFKVAGHMGVGVAGLTPDGSKFFFTKGCCIGTWKMSVSTIIMSTMLTTQ